MSPKSELLGNSKQVKHIQFHIIKIISIK